MKEEDKKDSQHIHNENEAMSCWNMNRRKFLQAMGTVSLAALVNPLDLLAADSTVSLPLPAAPTGAVTVGVARGSTIEAMVRSAVGMAGGLGAIKSGDKVLIKPNITGPNLGLSARIYTSPNVLRAVIKMVKEKTAARNITVAEAAGFGAPTTPWAIETGIYSVCLLEGVNWVAWEDGPYTYVKSPYCKYVTYPWRVPTSIATNAFKHFINVPLLKNHDMCVNDLLQPNTDVDYTCCIKHSVGVMHPYDRLLGAQVDWNDLLSGKQSIVNEGIHNQYLGENVAEMNLATPNITMNIVDALTPILKGGPANLIMTHCDANLILASTDRVACDSVAVAVLKHYAIKAGLTNVVPYVNKSVWAQAQIVRAQQLNLGRTKGNISVTSSGVSEINTILKQWV